MSETSRKVGRKYRIVQWATGTVGKGALRAVLDHPDMELVGVRVYSEAKEGIDAGTICGRPETGVLATRNVDTVLAQKPDCVIYMPESTDLGDVCRILESGANIVSTRADFFNPKRMRPEVRERVEIACQRGGSSIYCSGSSPGFITEALPIVLLSLQRRLDLLMIDEFANCIDGCSDEMLVNIMGFGDTLEEFARRDIADRDDVFEHSLYVLAEASGIQIDHFEQSAEAAVTKAPVKLHSRSIDAGTVGGQRFSTTAIRNGKPVLRFRSNWFVTTELDKDWYLRSDGWRVTVEGDTPLDITIAFPIEDNPAVRQAVLPGYTAHRPVNAIAAICAAPPGIFTTATLPQVFAKL